MVLYIALRLRYPGNDTTSHRQAPFHTYWVYVAGAIYMGEMLVRHAEQQNERDENAEERRRRQQFYLFVHSFILYTIHTPIRYGRRVLCYGVHTNPPILSQCI